MRQKFGFSIVIGLVSVAVALVAIGIGSEAMAKNKEGKKAAKGQMLKGKIESVENDTLTVLTKENGAQKVQLTSDTLYRQQDGKKGTAAAIAQTDLKAGQHLKFR